MRKILKILTFIIITLTAYVLIFKPELVRTMIPGILEKIYVTINNIIPIERGVDLKLSIIAVALIMPIFAGIMRSISDFNAAGIVGALMPFMLIIETGLVGILFGGFIIFMLFFVPSLFVVISYIYCCFLIFSDSVESWYSSSSSGYSSYGSSSSSNSGYSSSGSGSYTGQNAYCDPDEYIARNGFSYICGVTSDKDIDKINNDPLLTDEQKEAIKRALDSKASLYY